ncbi:MAG TPA: hypothetical protein VL442_06780 [Mucilaginibacter sp.]|nr:hypothetical protein [Mucilaginibacter sp.]
MTKKYLTTHAKEHKLQQHCPICNRYKKYSERYPEYVCEKCIKLATDKTGTSIGFYNITYDGHGCQGRYIESGKLYRGTTCYIKGIKCYAEEAYLGGIIIRPSGSRKSKSEEPTIFET